MLQGVPVLEGRGVEEREEGAEMESPKRDEEGEGAHWGVTSPSLGGEEPLG
jgi:hypothetical protein